MAEGLKGRNGIELREESHAGVDLIFDMLFLTEPCDEAAL